MSWQSASRSTQLREEQAKRTGRSGGVGGSRCPPRGSRRQGAYARPVLEGKQEIELPL